ncbi:hypothetical protein [Blastopirellula marina]|uniref:VWFA domain-containing protein n=1 Tax=Blastopirellula marina TaxID=124 RepID=A0A2S8G6T0_9BACT|nr:hypothetical protein [Blastopirellula marina]PQO40152.1 hypothetical protein C5Y98_05980 [Blastopirellula marina]PTL45519.1 hypothetical protein C5Y97_05980 [Blastopirellula marina]
MITPIHPPEAESEKAKRRFALPAWLMSTLVHVTVIVVLAITIRTAPRGAASEPSRSGGIVLAERSDGRTEYVDGDADDASQAVAAATNAEAAAAESLPSVDQPPLDMAGFLPTGEGGEQAGSEMSGLPSASGLTGGGGGSKAGLDGAGTTRVFGIEGTGSRFAYVFDRSGSMSNAAGRPLAAAKSELLASLRDLDKLHQFQIIFYNEEPRVFNPLGGTPRLMFADDQGKALAEQFVGSISATGGTNHLKAIHMALAMNPDVIFFLSDADGAPTEEEMAEIRRRNRSAVINTIEFGFGPYDGRRNFLVRLAEENGGQHAYIDTSTLGSRR